MLGKKRKGKIKTEFKPILHIEMPIKVLLSGEGVTDHGELIPSGGLCQFVKLEGACQPLIRKCADNREMEFLVAERWREWPTFNGSKMPSNNVLPGHAKKSYICTLLAGLNDCPIVVVLIDGDKASRKKAPKPKLKPAVKKRVNELRGELEIGFSKAKEKLADGISTVRMVPMRMLESWLMADANAIKIMTGVDPGPILKGKYLEGMWGKEENPVSDHPKCVMNRILKGSSFTAGRESFRCLAEETDLKVLVKRCPESAKPFVDEAQAVFGSV